MAKIPKQVQKLRDEQAKLGKLGRCQASHAGGPRHDDLHFRRPDCVQFTEATGKAIAENTFAKF